MVVCNVCRCGIDGGQSVSHHKERLTGLHVGKELESRDIRGLHLPCDKFCSIPVDIALPAETPGGVRIGHTGCEVFKGTRDAGAFLCWWSIGSYTGWGLRWPRTTSPGWLHRNLGSALLGPWGLWRKWGSTLLGPWSKRHGSGRALLLLVGPERQVARTGHESLANGQRWVSSPMPCCPCHAGGTGGHRLPSLSTSVV
jgi:hypothetical protein